MRNIYEEEREQRVEVEENALLCPITQEVMTDPVIAQDGYTYERAAITEWQAFRGTSPITIEPISNVFKTNRALVDIIDVYKKQEALRILDISDKKKEPVPQILYSDLLKMLEIAFVVPSKEIRYGSIVEQTLVALAGIYTDQKGASFDRDNDNGKPWNICFSLSFKSAAEHQIFTMHYRSKFPGCIINNGQFEQESTKIIFDTQVFAAVIIPVLGEHKKNGHKIVMQELCRVLQVDFQDVYTGDAVERRLVGSAGVLTSQQDAYYRRNVDYTTVFHLAFESVDEHKQFVAHYQEKYPNFIIKDYGYNGAGLCKFDMNTKRLLTQVAPGLSDEIDRQMNDAMAEQANTCVIF